MIRLDRRYKHTGQYARTADAPDVLDHTEQLWKKTRHWQGNLTEISNNAFGVATSSVGNATRPYKTQYVYRLELRGQFLWAFSSSDHPPHRSTIPDRSVCHVRKSHFFNHTLAFPEATASEHKTDTEIGFRSFYEEQKHHKRYTIMCVMMCPCSVYAYK